MKLKFLALCTTLSLSVLLTGCTSSDMQAMFGNGSAVSTVKHIPTTTNKIKIYYGNRGLPKNYKVIGQVTAEHHNWVGIPFSESAITEELKKQAASIGGMGIIDLTQGLDSTTGEVIVYK